MERQHVLWHVTQGRFSPLKVFYTLLRRPNLLQYFLTPWLSNACVQTFFTFKI